MGSADVYQEFLVVWVMNEAGFKRGDDVDSPAGVVDSKVPDRPKCTSRSPHAHYVDATGEPNSKPSGFPSTAHTSVYPSSCIVSHYSPKPAAKRAMQTSSRPNTREKRPCAHAIWRIFTALARSFWLLRCTADTKLKTQCRQTSSANERDIPLPQLVLLDLQCPLQNLLRLGSTDSDVARNLFVTADTKVADSVARLGVDRRLASQLLEHLGGTGETITGFTDRDVWVDVSFCFAQGRVRWINDSRQMSPCPPSSSLVPLDSSTWQVTASRRGAKSDMRGM